MIQNKIFGIKKVKNEKRIGRKRKGAFHKDEKTHSKYDKDNITRKIQVHFQNFLVSFINEILKHFEIKNKFLNIDYNNKKYANKEFVEKLKSKEIGEILRQDISAKYKKQYKADNKINNKLYLEVIKIDIIRKILSEKYINIFINFYYGNKRVLNDYNLNIQLSDNVKIYQDLLEEYSGDSNYIIKIKQIVETCYLPKKIFISSLK